MVEDIQCYACYLVPPWEWWDLVLGFTFTPLKEQKVTFFILLFHC